VDGKEIYRDLKRTCTAIVQLIKPFVWWRSRCRPRRGLLELPNASTVTATRTSPKNEQIIGYARAL